MAMKSLILVGGLSSRMGTPKYALLQRIDPVSQRTSQPILVVMLLRHHQIQMDLKYTVSEVCIATRNQHQKDNVHQLLAAYEMPQNMHISYVLDDHTVSGPSAGLLAARSHDQISSWLVTGCDYPLLSVDALKQLSISHAAKRPTLTCFVNSEGFAEPLLAIWTPTALQVLSDLAVSAELEGRTVGPTRAIKVLQHPSQAYGDASLLESFRVDMIEPADSCFLRNVNTLEEWHEVQDMLEQSQSVSKRAG